MDKKHILKIISKVSLIPLISIPATLLMFVILPRTSYPFFDFLNRGGYATTGFTDSILLGAISGLQEDNSVIFRASMNKINESELYWRGITLEVFDGISWKPAKVDNQSTQGKSITSGRLTKQTIYLEPYENNYLFALDKPINVSLRDVIKTEDLTYYMPENIFRKTKYEAVSIISDTFIQKEIDTRKYLDLPDIEGIEEIRALTFNITDGLKEEEKITALLRFLRDGDFRYSLKKLPVSKMPLRDFLLNHKYGNCEYFASAMAVMLRIINIPSRLVGGYLGGYYNDAGRYYMVMQKNAHVWVEAYIKDRWIRIDPTPLSIEGFTSLDRYLIRLRLLLDTINYYWNNLIINYDLQKQFSLFQKIRFSIKKPNLILDLTPKDIIKYSFVLLIPILMLYWRFRKKAPVEKRIISEFEKRLKRHGYERRPSEGLEELTMRIKEPHLKESAYEFVNEFEKIYYMDKKIYGRDLKRLKTLIRKIE